MTVWNSKQKIVLVDFLSFVTFCSFDTVFLILTLVYQETQSNCDRDSVRKKKGAHINQIAKGYGYMSHNGIKSNKF